jgi:cytoskeletal protein RodZ
MASFGEALKHERESRNISLREIAETTKINIRYLEALEAERFTALPGGIFNRGFVRAYANYIGIDSDATLRDYNEAMSASGMESNEGALPHPDRVTPRARRYQRQTNLDSGRDEGAPHARISMGPDPEAREGGVDQGDEGGDTRRAGRRRFVMITFLVVVGGALLAGLLLMRRDRARLTPERAIGIEQRLPAELSAEQEAFDLPEGMFVDAGPAAAGEDAAENPEEEDAPEAEQPREPPPQKAETTPKPPRDRAKVEPAVAGIGGGPAPRPVAPAAPQPKSAEADAPEPMKPATEAEREEAQVPPPQIPPSRSSEPAPPPPGPMALEVELTRETWLWLACDSVTRIDRRAGPGKIAAMECLRSIRVSAHDAGALRLRVNGADCIPLGDDGTRVFGYTIRFDDAHLICRSANTN